MRLRIFSISLLTGLVSAVLVTAIHLSYVRSERIHFIDQRLRETALELINSDLVGLRRGDDQAGEEILSDELGPDRIGKIFVIRNSTGQILFQSRGAAELEGRIPQSPTWVDHVEGDRTFRVLNLSLPKINDRTLQVGMAVEDEFAGWGELSWRIGAYAAAVAAITVVTAAFLSTLVMRPFRVLHRRLEEIGDDLSSFREVRPIPYDDFRFALRRRGDEFGKTLTMLNSLIDRINATARITKLWSAKLAHELKTPLTILRLEIEDAPLDERPRAALLGEISRLTAMVGGFLSLAEAGSAPNPLAPPEIAAGTAVNAVVSRLEKLAKGRVTVREQVAPEGREQSGPKVRALPEHLDAVVSNLIDNALKYSPGAVEVAVGATGLEVRDAGPGLPPRVRESLGSPFNRGGASARDGGDSNGLGLALVVAICRRYGWSFRIEQEGAANVARVDWKASAPSTPHVV